MFRSVRCTVVFAHLLSFSASTLAFGWVPGYGHSSGQKFISQGVVGTGQPILNPNRFCDFEDWFWPSQSTCGPGVGACDEGFCCSGDGRCTKSFADCLAPRCQLAYGPGCHGNQGPRSGVDTSVVPRPRLGAVPYGGHPNVTVAGCTVPGTIAVTYDDGPSYHTEALLDLLRTRHPDARVTFFVVGNNGGRGDLNDGRLDWPRLLRRMVAEGHQVASHTWTHEDSRTLDEARMTEQMVWTEMALSEVLDGHRFPTYMRPPYDECSPACETVMDRLGYHVIYQNVNNEDWRWDSPDTIHKAKENWDRVMQTADPTREGFITLEHDVLYQTVYNMTDYMLTTMKEKGWRAVTVGECLGDAKENWYRTGPQASRGPQDEW